MDIAAADVGDGEPVVLMHAGVADSRMWSHIVPALAAEFRVLTFDFRGDATRNGSTVRRPSLAVRRLG